MKKIIFNFVIISIISLLIVPVIAKADDSIKMKTTKMGVEMPMTDYDKLCNVYNIEYVENMSQELYELLISNIDNVEISTYEEMIPVKGTYFQSPSKSVTLIKNGSIITLVATWIKVPGTKAYDVIAVRLYGGVSINGNVSFLQTYLNNGSSYGTNDAFHKSLSNGYGCSFKLRSGTSQSISLTFQVSGTGRVYGSYQHAFQTTTLAESKKYTVSSAGYGGVVDFYGGVGSKYDNMTGVDIAV